MKPIMQLLYRVRRLLLQVTGWRTRGVKVMVFNERGELLLVRNSYGKTQLWLLPGGGIHRGESPGTAAAREVREEVGVALTDLTAFGTYVSEAEGKRDTVHLFTASTAEEPRADGVEVTEARFVPLDALPDNTSPATVRRIAEYAGERVTTRW